MTPKRISIISCLGAIGICIGLCLYMFYGLNIDPICWIYGLIFSVIGYVFIIDGCKSHIFVPIIGGVHIISWVLLLWSYTPYSDVIMGEFFGIPIPFFWSNELGIWLFLGILCFFHFIICIIYGSWSRVYVYLKRKKAIQTIHAEEEKTEDVQWYENLKNPK